MYGFDAGLIGVSAPFQGNLREMINRHQLPDIWAVGIQGGFFTHELIEHFNGTSWSVVPSPFVRNSHLSGVSGTSSTDVWAVGTGRSTSDHVKILHWNGTA